MKNFKKIIGKVVILLAACFMFASFSPSLDGRVVVVDQGEFPQGLFAKTVGYLPGDIISVANITGDNTVDLLVIGALDPSEGVAIMITPEAAQAIGIEKDSNNIVKITKRSGQDERVYGTAVIAKQNLAQLNNESTYDETDEYGFEDETSEINETEFEQSTNDENEPFTETEEEALSEETEEFEETLDTDEESETETEDSFEETDEESYEDEIEESESEEFEETINENEEEYFEEEPTEEEFEEEFSEENEESALEDSIEQDPFEEEPEEQIEELVQTPLESEELDETQEPYSEEQIEGIEENNETENTEIYEEIPSEEFYEEEILDDLVLEPLEEFSPTLLEEKKDEEIESEQTEPLTEETSDAEIEDVELTEESVELEDETETEAESENTESEEFVEIEETKEEEYEAIVLIPTNSMPPVQNEEEKTEEPSQTETSEEKTESFDELPAETPAEPDTDTEEKPELEQSTEVLSYEKYMVGSLKDLESGKYYIQIATLSIDANIMEIVNKYSKNYPITIVPMAGGIRKQIMVGPLSVDEYAVVLERFRSYGYKDAFLRKIK